MQFLTNNLIAQQFKLLIYNDIKKYIAEIKKYKNCELPRIESK